MSDSDESDVVPIKRKRRYNIDDSEPSSESDSSVIVGPPKRVKTRLYDSSSERDSDGSSIQPHRINGSRAIRTESESSDSSDWQSDWSSDDNPSTRNSSNDLNNKNSHNYDNSSSDSNDENSEKCPICLVKLAKQEVATPELCEHVFCFQCLQEWSRNFSTCPIDRKDFRVMLVRKHYNSSHRREVQVIQNKKPVEEEIIEDPTFCEICNHSDREDSMLLCDGCDHGFHMECLTPPIEQVPLGDWFCDSCVESNNSTTDEADRDVNTSRHNHSSRLIPRTRQSERVRTTVETQRVQARTFTLINIFDPDQPSTSSGFVSNETSMSRSQITKTSRKSTSTRKSNKRRTRRRRVARRRKYVTEYEICQETGAKIPVKKLVPSKTRRRTKRSTRKRKVRRSKKKSSKQQSTSKRKSESSSSKLLMESGEKNTKPTLHLFGRRDELYYFSDDSDVEAPISNKEKVIKKLSTKPNNLASDRNISTASSSINLLDSIMESQAQWHSKKSQLTVERDGKLIIKNKHNG